MPSGQESYRSAPWVIEQITIYKIIMHGLEVCILYYKKDPVAIVWVYFLTYSTIMIKLAIKYKKWCWDFLGPFWIFQRDSNIDYYWLHLHPQKFMQTYAKIFA